jgi:AbrB family looped-hinge helix DNA binding protein
MFSFRRDAVDSDNIDPQILNNAGNNMNIAHKGDNMTSSIIDPRFRITIPKVIRERAGLQVGDKVGFLNDGDQIIMVKVPEDPLLAMAGSLHFNGDVRQYLRELKEEDLAEED